MFPGDLDHASQTMCRRHVEGAKGVCEDERGLGGRLDESRSLCQIGAIPRKDENKSKLAGCDSRRWDRKRRAEGTSVPSPVARDIRTRIHPESRRSHSGQRVAEGFRGEMRP
ncbi:hypothetical protein CPLU01_04806 [Colletotrichum plurivorum]|uniref:Uncharacterized protein n=1 Tax=Colletotrichum plurivorum TaxID=2175906 RepID=A0A8H6KND9_9PEZI|nr:hypothetical protein CPLU01_04806 [Colletotrichum plurivorum]